MVERRPVVAGVTVLVAALFLACQAPAEPDLGAILDEVRRSVGSPGAIMAVGHRDGSVDRYASGVSDLESLRPVQATDAYHLGSIAKTLTAAVVFRLVEEGRLRLDDSLSRFLPDFPRGDEIELHNLLQQTSGLKDFYLYLYLRPDREEMIAAVTREWTQPELIELAGRFGHHFDPGDDWDYSNTNYFLLGVVVERASGMTLAEAYRHYVFDPLGMDRSWLVLYEPDRAELPLTGYLGPVAGWAHSDMFGELGPSTVLENSNAEWGAGGVVSTGDDALLFLRGLLNGGLLSSASLERMLESVPAVSLGAGGAEFGVPKDISSAYGHGIMRTRRPTYDLLGHGGIFAGHTAGLWHVPDSGLDVAVYFNRGFVPQRLLLDKLVRALE